MTSRLWMPLKKSSKPSNLYNSFYSRETVKTMEERTSFELGEEATLTRLFSEDDINAFARLTGDMNPIHMDETYAKTTRFGGRIVHGMLVASMFSSVLGNQLPGPGSIYSRQELQFRAPVRPGDRITAKVQVSDWDPIKGRIVLLTEATNQDGVVVISGEARLFIASLLK